MKIRGRARAVAGAILACVVLANCGGARHVSVGRMADPRHLSAAENRAAGIPRNFGDTKPHEWKTGWFSQAPEDYPVHGIDAARYQGDIDFYAARRAGVRFAWLKATEGGDHLDPSFPSNSGRARAAGVPVGAYHFYYFCRTPQEQARWFIDNVPRRSGDLPPVLDMEWNHQSRTCPLKPAPDEIRTAIRTYSDIVARHYGTPPVIYTTPDFYEQNDLGQLRGAEFWLRSVAGHPSERYPQERWSFWQYTGTGVVDGIGGIVDLNAYAGSARDWATWLAMRTQR